MTPKNYLLADIYDEVSPVTVKFFDKEITGTAKLFKSTRLAAKEIKDEIAALYEKAQNIKAVSDANNKKKLALIKEASDLSEYDDLVLLTKLFVSLDVTGSGESFPITVENLLTLPEGFTGAMFAALIDARKQKKTTTQEE